MSDRKNAGKGPARLSTIDEVIAREEAGALRCERNAELTRAKGGHINDGIAASFEFFAAERRQVAEWLKELQQRREADAASGKEKK